MRTASSTEDILTSTLTIAAPSVTASTPADATVCGPARRHVVQHCRPAGRTWRLARAVHAEPAGHRPGPERHPARHRAHRPPAAGPVRYTVAAGDTLSAIAAGLRRARRLASPVRGQPAGHRPRPGCDPPRHRAHRPAAALRRRPRRPRASRGTPAPAPPAAAPHHAQPGTRAVPAAPGMPPWLKTMLLAVGLLILVAFLAEPVLVAWRRRQRRGRGGAGGPERPAGPAGGQGRFRPGAGPSRRPGPSGAEAGGIVLADHDRLVVTCNERDDTVYVLRPPGAGPQGDSAGGPPGAAGGPVRGTGQAARDARHRAGGLGVRAEVAGTGGRPGPRPRPGEGRGPPRGVSRGAWPGTGSGTVAHAGDARSRGPGAHSRAGLETHGRAGGPNAPSTPATSASAGIRRARPHDGGLPA